MTSDRPPCPRRLVEGGTCPNRLRFKWADGSPAACERCWFDLGVERRMGLMVMAISEREIREWLETHPASQRERDREDWLVDVEIAGLNTDGCS
jgi:hypothetical protein